MVISDFDEVVHFAGYTPIFLLRVRRFNTAASTHVAFFLLNILIEIPDFASRMTNPAIISK